MKITVMGATGRIGTHLVEKLGQAGVEVVAASTSLGVNSVTGKGLGAAIAGADVVIDVTNAASFGDDSALDFFKASTRNLVGCLSRYWRQALRRAFRGGDTSPC